MRRQAQWQAVFFPQTAARPHNIYVDSGIGSIDGASYTGLATAVGFDAVSSIEGAPEALSKLKITFTDGDEDEPETLYVLYADYGSSLEVERVPEVPERDGFYGSWENISDCNNIRADVTVNALYLPYIETIESGGLDGDTQGTYGALSPRTTP